MAHNHNLGSGSGTNHAYFVEVRGVLDEPFQHPNGFLVTKDWRRVPIQVKHCDIHKTGFHSGMVGDIPVKNGCFGGPEDHLHLLDFEATYTLACLIQAQSGIFGMSDVYCRIVEVEVKYSWSAKAIGASKEIHLLEIKRENRCEPFEESK